MTTATEDLRNADTNPIYGLTWQEVAIPMRDGVEIRANLYRPDAPGRFPVLATMSPYGKDLHFTEFAPANPTIKIEYSHSQDKGPLLSWETPNPGYWVPQGYAILRIDERGIGRSPGVLDIMSEQLRQDYYDAIEWAGTQEWSSGRVGLTGISYLALSQWAVASDHPPHLTCIVPWEGTVDYYAEFCYPGGLMANGFLSFWYQHGVLSNQHNPGGSLSADDLVTNRADFMEFVRTHPLRDEAWKRRSGDVSRIEVPFLSASNWFSAGMHTRGNFLAFQHAPTEHKWLEVHIGSHVGEYYTIEGRNLQKRFLDHWLKDLDTGLMREPRVKLAIPTGGDDFTWRYENEYPLARTQWTRLFLDAANGTMGSEPSDAVAEAVFVGDVARESATWGKPYMSKPFDPEEQDPHRLIFRTEAFDEPIEILGPIKLHLWASSSTDDADVFVSLRHIGPDGREIVNSGSNDKNHPISQGWLKASVRNLDPDMSTEAKPYYSFDRVEKLEPGRAYPLEIELWDSAMVVAAGHSLLLEVGSRNQSGCGLTLQTENRCWDADVAVLTGGQHDTHLLLPVIPARS